MLLLEVEVEAGRQHERRAAAAELAHEARLVGLLVGGQLAGPVELSPATRVPAPVLPAVEPAARPAGTNMLLCLHTNPEERMIPAFKFQYLTWSKGGMECTRTLQ